MQSILNDTVLVILVASLVVVLFTVAYVMLAVTSNKKIIQEQESRINEIQKSERRYKALFENSLAGMMKFDFSTWMVLEANQAMLEMFSVESIFELQRVLTELPAEQLKYIENELLASGAIDAMEIHRAIPGGLRRRFLFSSRREGSERTAQAVMILMTSDKLIG